MQHKIIFLGLAALALAGCSSYGETGRSPHSRGFSGTSSYCKQIERQLHRKRMRHQTRESHTAVTESKLLSRYRQYGCEDQQD